MTIKEERICRNVVLQRSVSKQKSWKDESILKELATTREVLSKIKKRKLFRQGKVEGRIGRGRPKTNVNVTLITSRNNMQIYTPRRKEKIGEERSKG